MNIEDYIYLEKMLDFKKGEICKRKQKETVQLIKERLLKAYSFGEKQGKENLEKIRVKEFVSQTPPRRSLLKLSSGILCLDENTGKFHIGYETFGAKSTFSLSQPVFDEEKNLLGFLGIGCLDNLNYSLPQIKEKVPVYIWQIEKPTKFCRNGIRVYTYWQNYNLFTEKEEN